MKRLELLDYARMIAALGVVAYHYLFLGPATDIIKTYDVDFWFVHIAKYGFYGVHLFFMISGYVIFFSAKGRSAAEFAAARALRLYPCFWVCVVLTSLVIITFGAGQRSVGLMQFLANLTMLPEELGYARVDSAYWTLSWEIHFYFLVFMLILILKNRRLEWFFIAWPVAMLVARLLGKPYFPFLGGYYCFFAAGALYALIKSRWSWLAIGSLLVSFGLCLYMVLERAIYDWQNKFVLTCLVTGMFLFFALLHTRLFSEMKLPGSKLAGGLTYPVYLIHQVVGYVLLNRFATQETMVLWITLVTAGSLLTAYLVHILAERRLSWLWKEVFNTLIAWPIDKALAALGHGHRLTLVKARGLLKSQPPGA